MVSTSRYFHPGVGRAPEITEDPVRKEINTIIACIHEANYATAENSAEEAGFTKEKSKNGKNAIAIHVVEYFTAEEPGFLGLFTREIQKMNVICILRYNGSSWKIRDSEVYSTEKLADLFRHFKYYNLNVLVDGISESYLKELYIEARKARPGVIDRPIDTIPENPGGFLGKR